MLLKKDGTRLRLKVDMDDHMGGHLWTWVEDSDVKEVLTAIPKVPEDKLFE